MTQNPKCPKCGETHVIKYGKVQGKQRFICKHCNYQFTRETIVGYPVEMKMDALRLYCSSMSIRAIARFLYVAPQTVANWINEFGQKLTEKAHPVP